MKLDAILSPAELPALAQKDLSEIVCVVFDILRATSTFVTALQNGAKEIIPVAEISEALARKKSDATILLAGERDGLKISAKQTGGIDFDFGNSPREFTAEKVCGKTIASTTTNGTRALRACEKANSVLACSFLNLTATANFLKKNNFQNVLLVCAGTGENIAEEDVLAAGALCELLQGAFSTSAKIAHNAFISARNDLAGAMQKTENARRLLAIPELRDDVKFCSQRDIFNLVIRLERGALRVSI